MTHRDLLNWLRYRTKFLSPMNDFEIAMIISDIKILPPRITREPASVEQHRIELTAKWDVNHDTGEPMRVWPVY